MTFSVLTLAIFLKNRKPDNIQSVYLNYVNKFTHKYNCMKMQTYSMYIICDRNSQTFSEYPLDCTNLVPHYIASTCVRMHKLSLQLYTSLFWTLHTFNMDTTYKHTKSKWYFRLHLQYVSLNWCNSSFNSVLHICQPSEFDRQLLSIPTGKKSQVSQHIQETGGCHSCFGTKERSNQIILQKVTPYVNCGAVSNVSHCSTSVFWSPDEYTLFVDLPWNVECNFIRKDDFPQEFTVFVKFLIQNGPYKFPMCYILPSGGIAQNTCNL